MSNMSYCRFHNTVIDLEDCLGAIEEHEALSPKEFDARQKLLDLCYKICKTADSLELEQETYEQHKKLHHEKEEDDEEFDDTPSLSKGVDYADRFGDES